MHRNRQVRFEHNAIHKTQTIHTHTYIYTFTPLALVTQVKDAGQNSFTHTFTLVFGSVFVCFTIKQHQFFKQFCNSKRIDKFAIEMEFGFNEYRVAQLHQVWQRQWKQNIRINIRYIRDKMKWNWTENALNLTFRGEIIFVEIKASMFERHSLHTPPFCPPASYASRISLLTCFWWNETNSMIINVK